MSPHSAERETTPPAKQPRTLHQKRLIAHNALFEPGNKIVVARIPSSNAHYQIVHLFVFRDIQMEAASFDQNFRQDPGRSLVAIGKPMVSDHTVQQGRGFSGD